MSIQQIITLLEFCLTNTYSLFKGKYYEQLQGAAMGCFISPLIANLFMEEFEVKALSSCPHPLSLWLRFVDGTFVIINSEHSQSHLQHINGQDSHIQFIVGEPIQQGTLPLLDTLFTIGPNNTFSTSVYRKPTHTGQYLHWDSSHHITAKQSVYNTLAHRAKTVFFSNQETLDKKSKHINKALQAYLFPNWLLHQLQQKFLNNNPTNHSTNEKNNSNQDNNNSTNNTKNRNIILVAPYIMGNSEKFERLCKAKGIQVHFKGTNTLRSQLVNPKDKDHKLQKSGIIYHYRCPHLNCPEAYIGKSGRALGDRVNEYLKAPSPIYNHSASTGHPLDPNCLNTIHKEINSYSRTV